MKFGNADNHGTTIEVVTRANNVANTMKAEKKIYGT